MSDLKMYQKHIFKENKISRKEGKKKRLAGFIVPRAEIMLLMANDMLCVCHTPLLRALAHLLCSTTGKRQ